MTLDIVKIHPKAANAFIIEVYDNQAKLSYILDVHTDGDELHILSRDADGKTTTLLATKGYSSQAQQTMPFRVLCIEPAKKRARVVKKA